MFTIFTAFVTVALDQLVKYFVYTHMDLGETIPVFTNIFHLTYISNPGAAFGVLPNQDFFLLGIVGILFIAFVWLRDRIPSKPLYFPIAVGCVLGGALGNAIDRVRFGGVVDFFDFRVWPIFNVADIAICLGVTLIMLYFWRHDG